MKLSIAKLHGLGRNIGEVEDEAGKVDPKPISTMLKHPIMSKLLQRCSLL